MLCRPVRLVHRCWIGAVLAMAVMASGLLVSSASASASASAASGSVKPKLSIRWPVAAVAGRSISVSGSLRPARPRLVLRLQRLVGGSWRVAAQGRTGRGAFKLAWVVPASTRKVKLRVVVRRNGRVIASAVKTVTFAAPGRSVAPVSGASGPPHPASATSSDSAPALGGGSPAPGAGSGDAPAGGSSPGDGNDTNPDNETTAPVAVPAPTTVTTAPKPGSDGDVTLAGTSNVQPGDFLAVGVGDATPDGFLGKVTAVHTEGGHTVVSTTPAALTDVLPEGDIDQTMASDEQSSDSASSLRGGRAAAALSLSCGQSGKLTIATPKVTLSKSITFKAHWSILHGLESASLIGDVTAKASINAGVSGTVHCSVPSTAIAEFKGTPVTFQVGPVPVVLTPNAEVTVAASADASASLTTGLSVQASARAGAEYVKGDGTSPVASFTPSWSYTAPTVAATADVSASITPTVNVLVYGVAGPELAFKAGLAFDADIDANPWWTLTAPVDLTAQLVVPALKLSTGKLHVFQKTYALAKAPGPFEGTGTNAPALIAVTPVDGGARLTWTPPQPRDGITATSVLVQTRPGGSDDDNGWSNTDYVTGSIDGGNGTTASPGYIHVVEPPGTQFRIIYEYTNAGLASDPSNIVTESG
jgi:hypothetical protein